MLDRREQDIVEKARAGDRQAFGELVRRYQNLVTSIAFSRSGDLQRSEDIAQQVFLIAWEKRAEIRDPERYPAWLRSITRNVTSNSNRKMIRHDRAATNLKSRGQVALEENGVEALVAREQQELLWSSLQNIPQDYREPLILFYREDRSVKEVAQQLGLSTDAVKQRLSRGRAMLKTEVAQFVEDLLGTTKPRAAFASTILAALPAISATTQVAVKSSLVVGGKSMLSKLGLVGFGTSAGVLGGILGGALGIWGAWYGTRVAAKHATSRDEQTILWRTFYTVTVMSLVLTALSVLAAFLLPSNAIFGFVTVSTVAYSILLAVIIIRFTNRQKALHELHGKPDYPGDLDGVRPQSPASFRFASIGSTIGCWTWVMIMGWIDQAWVVVGIAVILFLAHVARSWPQASARMTGPQQTRTLANGVMANAVLAFLLVTIAEFAGSRLDFGPLPNWSVGGGVLVLCLLVGWGIRLAANQAEKKLAQQSQSAGDKIIGDEIIDVPGSNEA